MIEGEGLPSALAYYNPCHNPPGRSSYCSLAGRSPKGTEGLGTEAPLVEVRVGRGQKGVAEGQPWVRCLVAEGAVQPATSTWFP